MNWIAGEVKWERERRVLVCASLGRDLWLYEHYPFFLNVFRACEIFRKDHVYTTLHCMCLWLASSSIFMCVLLLWCWTFQTCFKFFRAFFKTREWLSKLRMLSINDGAEEPSATWTKWNVHEWETNAVKGITENNMVKDSKLKTKHADGSYQKYKLKCDIGRSLVSIIVFQRVNTLCVHNQLKVFLCVLNLQGGA